MGAIEFGNQISGPIEPVGPIEVLDTQELGTEPAAHGLTLFREQTSIPLVSTGTLAYHAEVTVFGGVATYKFLADWSGQAALVCSRLQVRAVPYYPAGVDFAEEDLTTWKHGAMVGFGGWHAGRPLTLTLARLGSIGSSTVAGAGGQVVPVGTPIDVPVFGRRLFLRGGVQPVDDGILYALTELAPVHLESIYFGRTPIGCEWTRYADWQRLTPDLLRDGIDVTGMSRVTLWTPGLPVDPRFTPSFELAL